MTFNLLIGYSLSLWLLFSVWPRLLFQIRLHPFYVLLRHQLLFPDASCPLLIPAEVVVLVLGQVPFGHLLVVHLLPLLLHPYQPPNNVLFLVGASN